jgi:hypothetical protein
MSDREALSVGNGSDALQRIIGNIEGETIDFGWTDKTTGKTAVHDTGPIKAPTGEICTVPLKLPPCPASLYSQPRRAERSSN